MSDQPLVPNAPGRPKDLAKRQSILDAAKILFLSKGFASTSMDAVANLAGVSKLTVYSHFTDKETLFSAAVMAKCTEQLPELFFALPHGVPIETVLLNIGRGFHTLINSEESLNLHRLMITLGSQDPKLSQIFFEAGPHHVVLEMERLLSAAFIRTPSYGTRCTSLVKLSRDGAVDFLERRYAATGQVSGENREKFVPDPNEKFVPDPN